MVKVIELEGRKKGIEVKDMVSPLDAREVKPYGEDETDMEEDLGIF